MISLSVVVFLYLIRDIRVQCYGFHECLALALENMVKVFTAIITLVFTLFLTLITLYVIVIYWWCKWRGRGF